MSYIFTFCCGEEHQNHGKFVRIPEDDYGKAREKMVKLFGLDWAFQYEEEAFMEQMKNLPEFFRETELKLTKAQREMIT